MTLKELLQDYKKIYFSTNNRLYSTDDLLYYQNKFLIRFLNQGNKNKTDDLIIAFAWFLSLLNRIDIDITNILYKRYSYKCPFCLEIPCVCSENFPQKTKKVGRPNALKPVKLFDWQKMVEKIYPHDDKSINLDTLLLRDDLHCKYRKFQKERKKKFFAQSELSCADLFIAYLRIFNRNKLKISEEYKRLFKNGCYVCHKNPCQCMYSE